MLNQFVADVQGQNANQISCFYRLCLYNFSPGPLEILSPEKKVSKNTLRFFPLCWMVNRDPYFMVYYNPYIAWVVFHPLYNPTNKTGPCFHCSIGFNPSYPPKMLPNQLLGCIWAPMLLFFFFRSV